MASDFTVVFRVSTTTLDGALPIVTEVTNNTTYLDHSRENIEDQSTHHERHSSSTPI